MSYGSVPPPSSISSNYPQKLPPQSSTLSERKMIKEHLEKQYDDLISSSKKSSEKGPTKKPFLGHDEYFDRESDEEDNETGGNEGLDRLQIPQRKKEFSYGGVGEGQDDGRQTSVEDEEEDDPLDAFMSTIDRQAQADKQESTRKEQKAMESNECSGGQTGRDDIEQDDMQESYFKFMEEYKSKHDNDDDDEQYEYDEDGNIIWSWKKEIEPLPPIDHSQISYRPFCKSPYTEHPDIASLTPKKVFELRVSLDVRVFGRDIPKPVTSFAHFSFDKSLLGRVQKSDFEKPTPIQAQAIPIALQGRDVLGLAKTGSGKTAAYLWPAICHILNQEELDEGDGPIALIVIPTRELSIQVYQQASFYCKPFGISIVCAYGGGSKYEQSKELAGGAELVICTPGRIIDLIKCKATNFLRTTFLVFDEVDRMFDLGFEPQVKSIADHVRPDRQCLMFSATMKDKIERLTVNILSDPVKVICGDVGEANTDVEQTIVVLPDLEAKYQWLYSKIIQLITMGKVLVFVTKKVESEDVAKKLRLRDIDLVLLHGDMHQHERNEQMSKFRAGLPVLVATDVAARGLDIMGIKNVINFDVARDIDTHIHRVGRTGRAGQKGFAYTLITGKDSEFSAHLVKNLEATEQPVSHELMQVALKCPWFKKQRDENPDKSLTLATKQRTGLGYTAKDSSQGGKPDTSYTFASSGHSSSGGSSQQPSISKTIDKAKMIANTGVTGMSKMEIVRSTLKGTYKHTFQRASDDSSDHIKIPASDPRPEWKRKLDERTERINQMIKQKEHETTVSPSSGENPDSSAQKKRSRWH